MKKRQQIRFAGSRRLLGAVALAGAIALAHPAAAGNITLQDVEVEEGADARFTFKISPPIDLYFRYKYETVDGTAKSGRDYESKSGYLVFDRHTTQVTLTVATLVDDDPCENDETFKIEFGNPEAYWNGWSNFWIDYDVVPGNIEAEATIEGWGLENSGNYSTQHLGCGGGFGE